MPTPLQCPHCAANIEAPDAAAGKEPKCPTCKRSLAAMPREEFVTAAPSYRADGVPGGLPLEELERSGKQATADISPVPTSLLDRRIPWWAVAVMLGAAVAVVAIIVLLVEHLGRPPGTTTPSRPQVAPSTRLEGTTWVGKETAKDNTNILFIFKDHGKVVQIDDHRTWTGTWLKTSETTVRIDLTWPTVVNYYGEIYGGVRMEGTARNARRAGFWRFTAFKR